MVWEPNYDILNMLFCLLRNLSTLQTGNCYACQPITMFQKGTQINCNFSGRAIETVKQTEPNWFCLYFKHWKYAWFFKIRIDKWISKDLVLYCEQIYQNYDHTGNTASLPIQREAQTKTFNQKYLELQQISRSKGTCHEWNQNPRLDFVGPFVCTSMPVKGGTV